jgi:ABC-2 type transport system permease protein
MRALLAGRNFPVAMLVEGSVLAMVELMLAGFVYARVYRHAVRTGLLARYSAESAA